MKKIAIRGGHDYKCIGAVGIVSEVTEDRKIYAEVVKHLKALGYQVLDVTPTRCDTSSQDLVYGVSRANRWGADYFVSIHLNAGGGTGSEVLYQSAKGQVIADKICGKLSDLGFKNRGSKPNTRGLYELKKTIAVANIVECFFVDSVSDVALYKTLGFDKIGKAIAEGIDEGLKSI
jgi:N-acetylmuramoyl-L-alanine amidase